MIDKRQLAVDLIEIGCDICSIGYGLRSYRDEAEIVALVPGKIEAAVGKLAMIKTAINPAQEEPCATSPTQ